MINHFLILGKQLEDGRTLGDYLGQRRPGRKESMRHLTLLLRAGIELNFLFARGKATVDNLQGEMNVKTVDFYKSMN